MTEITIDKQEKLARLFKDPQEANAYVGGLERENMELKRELNLYKERRGDVL